MKWPGETSIRRRLQMVLLLTSSVVLVMSMSVYLVMDWFSLRDTLFERLDAQASIIGNNSIAALAFNDPASAEATLNTLHREEDIVAAGLYDPQGKRFAGYQRVADVLPAVLPDEGSGFAGDHAFAVLPIERDATRYGSILLISDFSDWERRIQLSLITSAGVLLLSLGTAILLSNRLQRLVSDPILKLAETARDVSKRRNYSLRAEKLTKDEIGDLVDDFNEMLRQIESRDRELQRIQEHLEEKVQDRTKQLTELTQQLEYQAYHDGLTGLANRTTFDDHLKMAIEQVDRYGGKAAVLFLDLDRFKDINDTLGHAIGDKLLVEIAERFRHCVRKSDTLARLGGDEFAVLLLHIETSDQVIDVARKLAAAIAEPFNLNDHTLHLSTSIGISLYPSDGGDSTVILSNADTAMYSSKGNGGNQFSFFSSEMNARAERRLSIENRLQKVLREGGLEVHYQPRLDTHTQEIVGVEALVRWIDPDEGPISPDEFIPVAEECGLIAQVDEWVLERACRDVLSWFDGGAPGIALAVNFSPAQFIRKDLSESIAAVLRRTGFPGKHLELEITESLFSADHPAINRTFEALVKLNVEIAVDDFGTAYSSLSRLKQLPLNTLKIDRTFIQDLGQDAESETIVRTIIDMAHNLNLKVVAEGVSNDHQYQFVKNCECDMVQGYLFGRAVDAEAMKKTLV